MLCPQCKEPYEAQDYELDELGMGPSGMATKLARKMSGAYLPRGVTYEPPIPMNGGRPIFYRPKGCDACGGSGYGGRRGIYELMLIDDAVRPLILKQADANAIRNAAIEQGMDTMRDDGARKVMNGMTSVEEVLTSTQDNVE
jgi:general secretion pathway protein E